MLPAGYNNNVQLLQTPDVIVIFNEMIHDARIIPLDDRPHIDDSIRQWRGDSRAWWEDDTLVIETTNFSQHTDSCGANAGLHISRTIQADRTEHGKLRVHGHRPNNLDKSLDSYLPNDPDDRPGLRICVPRG